MFGWITGKDITRRVEGVRDAGIELGMVRAAATVQVYASDVDPLRTYTGFEVYRLLDTIVTVLLIAAGDEDTVTEGNNPT